jgi:hypothetical protein
VRGGFDLAETATVHVPETAVNKDYFFVSDQHNIRMTGQVAAMQSITITHSMNYGTDSHFRLGVFPAYAEHITLD